MNLLIVVPATAKGIAYAALVLEKKGIFNPEILADGKVLILFADSLEDPRISEALQALDQDNSATIVGFDVGRRAEDTVRLLRPVRDRIDEVYSLDDGWEGIRDRVGLIPGCVFTPQGEPTSLRRRMNVGPPGRSARAKDILADELDGLSVRRPASAPPNIDELRARAEAAAASKDQAAMMAVLHDLLG